MGFVDTIIGKFFEKLFEFLPSILKKNPIEFIESPQIDEIAYNLVKSHLSVDYFFVLIAHDGKKKTKKYKYTSIVAGDYEGWLFPTLKVTDYIYYEIDDDYRAILDSVKQYGKFDVVSDTGVTNSKINTNMQALGIQRVRFFFLKENEEKGWLWYAAAGTKQVNENLNSNDHKHRFDIVINKIKNILKNH